MSARQKNVWKAHLWLKQNAIFIAMACLHVRLSPCLCTHTNRVWNAIKRNGKKLHKGISIFSFHCFRSYYHCAFASWLKICSHNSILSFRFGFFNVVRTRILSKCQQMCDNSNCDTNEVYLARRKLSHWCLGACTRTERDHFVCGIR